MFLLRKLSNQSSSQSRRLRMGLMWLDGGFSADLQVTTSYVVFYLDHLGNFPPIVSSPPYLAILLIQQYS